MEDGEGLQTHKKVQSLLEGAKRCPFGHNCPETKGTMLILKSDQDMLEVWADAFGFLALACRSSDVRFTGQTS